MLRNILFELAELSASTLAIASIVLFFLERLQADSSIAILLGGIIAKIIIRRYKEHSRR